MLNHIQLLVEIRAHLPVCQWLAAASLGSLFFHPCNIFFQLPFQWWASPELRGSQYDKIRKHQTFTQNLNPCSSLLQDVKVLAVFCISAVLGSDQACKCKCLSAMRKAITGLMPTRQCETVLISFRMRCLIVAFRAISPISDLTSVKTPLTSIKVTATNGNVISQAHVVCKVRSEAFRVGGHNSGLTRVQNQ